MPITPVVLATRAISSEFIRREYFGLFWVIGLALLGLHILGGWLIAQSAWWWVLEIIFIVITLIAVIFGAVAILIIKLLRPSQSKSQKKMVKSFVSSLQEITETAQTPKFILVFRLIRDIIFSRQNNLISDLTTKSGQLKPDFEEIVQSFNKQVADRP